MKTIQEQYNSHINGEVSKETFLYNLRRNVDLQNVISNLTGFDDTIRILKNKGIITEAQKKQSGPLTLDQVNPYEFSSGMTLEAELCYSASPAKPLAPEEILKIQNKVLKNLTKDPNFYTKTKAGITPEKGNLASDADFGKTSKRSDVMVPVKKDNFVDKKNAVTSAKKETANVKDTLGNKERAKHKVPKGVKVMTMVPKKQKGVKVMEIPGKEKKVRLKKRLKEAKKNSLLDLLENIPQSNPNPEFLPFGKLQVGMSANDDSNKTFRIVAIGDYNKLKQYDQSRTFDRFLSSDPQGIDATQLVAIKDANGNTSVRPYGTGGVYVFDKAQQPTNEYGSTDDLKNKEKAYLQAKIKSDQDRMNSIRENNKNMRENFAPQIAGKKVPQDEEAQAEAQAAILVTITKAGLQNIVDLDNDVVYRDGKIWVKISLGSENSLSKESLDAIAKGKGFLGLNPISNSEIAIVFSK